MNGWFPRILRNAKQIKAIEAVDKQYSSAGSGADRAGLSLFEPMKRRQRPQQSKPAGFEFGPHQRALRIASALFLGTLLAIVLSGCSHLRPPDDYTWNVRSGDPGGLDRATAAQWDFQNAVGENARKAMTTLPQVPRNP